MPRVFWIKVGQQLIIITLVVEVMLNSTPPLGENGSGGREREGRHGEEGREGGRLRDYHNSVEVLAFCSN